MARVEVPMPQMGESIAEGTVSVWLKKGGDRVERDEPIMEISTDKVDAEIPSPAAGLLAEIVVRDGEPVEVGTGVAYVETDASAQANAVPAPDPETPDEEPATPTAGDAAPKAQRERRRGGAKPSAKTGEAPKPDRAASPAVEAPAGEESAEDRLRRRSTPLVRRIAAEHG